MELNLPINVEELDQLVKSLMQSRTSNLNKRRRLNENSVQGRQATKDGAHIESVLTKAMALQRESWSA